MEILVTSIVAFASSNIDDIFLLTLFFANKKFNDKEVVTGQFLGISFLIAISLVGSLVGLFIDQAYIGLLGLVPIYLGVKGLLELQKVKGEAAREITERKNNILTVAGVTLANGGDNIGIYIPLFASLTWTSKVSMVGIFLLMTMLWCLTAKYFSTHPYVAKKVDQYGHLVTPFVLVLLGLYILYENETFRLLTGGI